MRRYTMSPRVYRRIWTANRHKTHAPAGTERTRQPIPQPTPLTRGRGSVNAASVWGAVAFALPERDSLRLPAPEATTVPDQHATQTPQPTTTTEESGRLRPGQAHPARERRTRSAPAAAGAGAAPERGRKGGSRGGESPRDKIPGGRSSGGRWVRPAPSGHHGTPRTQPGTPTASATDPIYER